MPNPIGIDPLNSISGTIDTKNINAYFLNITILSFPHLFNTTKHAIILHDNFILKINTYELYHYENIVVNRKNHFYVWRCFLCKKLTNYMKKYNEIKNA